MFFVLLAVELVVSVTVSRVDDSFFFFQAEDGIRDLTVTGVQTCALQILRRHSHGSDFRDGRQGNRSGLASGSYVESSLLPAGAADGRAADARPHRADFH